MEIEELDALETAALEEKAQIERQANYKLGELDGRINLIRELRARLKARVEGEGEVRSVPPPS